MYIKAGYDSGVYVPSKGGVTLVYFVIFLLPSGGEVTIVVCS